MERWTAGCSETVQPCLCLEVSLLWPQGSGYWLEAHVFGGENSAHDRFHIVCAQSSSLVHGPTGLGFFHTRSWTATGTCKKVNLVSWPLLPFPTIPHSKGVKSQVSRTVAGNPQIDEARKELGSPT